MAHRVCFIFLCLAWIELFLSKVTKGPAFPKQPLFFMLTKKICVMTKKRYVTQLWRVKNSSRRTIVLLYTELKIRPTKTTGVLWMPRPWYSSIGFVSGRYNINILLIHFSCGVFSMATFIWEIYKAFWEAGNGYSHGRLNRWREKSSLLVLAFVFIPLQDFSTSSQTNRAAEETLLR